MSDKTADPTPVVPDDLVRQLRDYQTWATLMRAAAARIEELRDTSEAYRLRAERAEASAERIEGYETLHAQDIDSLTARARQAEAERGTFAARLKVLEEVHTPATFTLDAITVAEARADRAEARADVNSEILGRVEREWTERLAKCEAEWRVRSVRAEDENARLREAIGKLLFHHEAWCRGGVDCPGAAVTSARALLDRSPEAGGTDDVALDIALAGVRAEVAKARAKHPPIRGPHEGYAVILEELDELWDEVKPDRGRSPDARKEAMQVAAMGIRYMLDVCAPTPDRTQERD